MKVKIERIARMTYEEFAEFVGKRIIIRERSPSSYWKNLNSLANWLAG